MPTAQSGSPRYRCVHPSIIKVIVERRASAWAVPAFTAAAFKFGMNVWPSP